MITLSGFHCNDKCTQYVKLIFIKKNDENEEAKFRLIISLIWCKKTKTKMKQLGPGQANYSKMQNREIKQDLG
jgi:hypothetical protein